MLLVAVVVALVVAVFAAGGAVTVVTTATAIAAATAAAAAAAAKTAPAPAAAAAPAAAPDTLNVCDIIKENESSSLTDIKTIANNVINRMNNKKSNKLLGHPPCTNSTPYVDYWDNNWMPKEPKIAMLFMIRSKLNQSTAWKIWLKDAKDKVNVYIHAADTNSTTPAVKEKNWPKGYIQVPYTNGEWGNLNEIMGTLLTSAINHDIDNTFFIFISETTIPLRPFCEIYDQLIENPRSRFSMSNNAITEWGTSKHSQWIVLIRPHAIALAQNLDQWTCKQWIALASHGSDNSVAAPDEYLPLYALLRIYGRTQLTAYINSGNGMFSDTDLYKHTIVSWNQKETAQLGHAAYGSSAPTVFDELKEQSLENLIEDKSKWFLRKVLSNATVIEEEDHEEWPLSKWLLKNGHLLCKQ